MLPSDGGVLMARNAFECVSSEAGFAPPKDELLPMSAAGENFITTKGKANGDSDTMVTKKSGDESNRKHGSRTDASMRRTKTDVFISNDVCCRLTDYKKLKYQGSPEKKMADNDDISIGENIAGNNAGPLPLEDILPIHYGIPSERNSEYSTINECATCGADIANGVCKQCLHRNKCPDPKAGTLDELLAYAQNFALSVKKMLSMKGTQQTKSSTFDSGDVSEISQSSASSMQNVHQSEQSKPKGISYVMGPQDRQPHRMIELPTPASSVCGDDLDNMSVHSSDVVKAQKPKMERQSSNVSNGSRPPLSRAKTKLKASVSSSKTKTFRPSISRTRTGYAIKNDSSLVTASKRSIPPESPRKSGRTQTFDSCNLHVRKEINTRSTLNVIQEGTSVDPPSDANKVQERALKYNISRSATSPGTNIKFLGDKTKFGTAMPLMRTNTKLTLRDNKAAALRKETIQRSNSIFGESNGDVSEGSPIVERKRITVPPKSETKPKLRQRAASVDRQNYTEPAAIEPLVQPVGEMVPPIENKLITLDTSPVPLQNFDKYGAEETGSDIYCIGKNYTDETKVEDTTDTNNKMVLSDRGSYGGSFLGRSPYCENLRSYGNGLNNQLVDESSAMTYFEKNQESEPIVKSVEAAPESNLYTDSYSKELCVQRKPKQRDSGHWYSLGGVMSKSSTQLRDATSVKSSMSDMGTVQNSADIYQKKQVKYSETDVDSGTIYHMAKRIASNKDTSSRGEFTAASNFFDLGGDVSKSSSCTSEHSECEPLDDVYTGGFFNETVDEADKKTTRKGASRSSTDAYFELDGKSSTKPEPLECDIYTGAVFSPSANNLALSGIGDNSKDMSTNNSNKLPVVFYRCRSRTTMAHINNRRILNCSNNSSSSAAKERSFSSDKRGPVITQSTNSSYLDYAGYKRPIVQPVNVSFDSVIDFSKYDSIGKDDTGFFISGQSKHDKDKDNLYQGGTYKFGYAFNNSPIRSKLCKLGEDVYTPGAWNTSDKRFKNDNNNACSGDLNNNYFGDCYADESPYAGGSQPSGRSTQSTEGASRVTKQSSPKYAPGSFYENDYMETKQKNPPQASQSSFMGGMFSGYGDPPSSQQRSSSPDYADFQFGSQPGRRQRSPGGVATYECYGGASQSPERVSYDQDGYFGFSSTYQEDKRDHLDLANRSPVQAKQKIKRVGAIICRENVANKDDYAEDVNRDLMEEPWIPISYRLASEQVKEMGGGGRSMSRELMKASEARCDQSMMDQSPFVQGQILEKLERRGSGWNLKNNTDNLKDDISMKWRDAREQGEKYKHKKTTSDSNAQKPTYSSVWRPNDHIPAKARGPRVINKPRDTKSSTSQDAKDANNSKVWSAVMWVPSTVGSLAKKIW